MGEEVRRKNIKAEDVTKKIISQKARGSLKQKQIWFKMPRKSVYPRVDLSDLPFCWRSLLPPTSADFYQLPSAGELQRGHWHTFSSGLSWLVFPRTDKGHVSQIKAAQRCVWSCLQNLGWQPGIPFASLALGLHVSHHGHWRWPQDRCTS